MSGLLHNILGGDKKEQQKPLVGDDAGFADFASAAHQPEPASTAALVPTLSATGNVQPTLRPTVPFTKWYRVWDRTQLSDFYQEMIIAPIILVVLFVHFFGLKANRSRAKDWARHHASPLRFEYAVVGIDGKVKSSDDDDDEGAPPREDIITEEKPNEFISYATGRNNVAFTDIKLTLLKRYNPALIVGEQLISFVMDSFPATTERMEAITFPFDKRETQLIPQAKDGGEIKISDSSYDGFVFAIIHKKMLRKLREDRYDLSLTITKDHEKLPAWTAVLSENGEITESLLTPELADSIKLAGDLFEALIVSDQPIDRPCRLSHTVPRKKISLSVRLPSVKQGYVATMPLFAHFLRMPDLLVQHAHFRPEVMRKVKATRENEINRIKRAEEESQAEERKSKADKDKKDKRQAMLSSMNASEQKKYLDKERDKEMRKGTKKKAMRA